MHYECSKSTCSKGTIGRLKMEKQEEESPTLLVLFGKREWYRMKVILPQDIIPEDASGVGNILDRQMPEIHPDGL